MQVLLVLADSAGQVVTRETLFNRCWGGVFAGDDSLNRAIAGVRRAITLVGGTFEVETIPRTGYRLTGAIVTRPPDAHSREFSRREIAGAAAGIVTLGGIAGWSIRSSWRRRNFEQLVAAAEEAIRKGTSEEGETRNQLLEAISLRPDSARPWGLLAFLASIGTISADPRKAELALKEAEVAAGRALAIDPKEPYALLALFELQGSTLDWKRRDERLRQIMAVDPSNLPAIAEIVLLTQAAGLNRESWDWNERAIALNPFSVDYLSKRALKLWIAARVSQADKVIDQVQALYPSNPWPWFVRFMIFAFSGRPQAAQAMLEATPENLGTAGEITLWRTALIALDKRSAEAIANLRQVCFKAVESTGGFAGDEVMMLSAVGDVDAAFEVANGFLLSRGSIVRKGEPHPRDDINDATWRISTQWLFTPPCALLRKDPRFLPLCEGIGLVDYWRARGVRPDYQVHQ